MATSMPIPYGGEVDKHVSATSENQAPPLSPDNNATKKAAELL